MIEIASPDSNTNVFRTFIRIYLDLFRITITDLNVREDEIFDLKLI